MVFSPTGFALLGFGGAVLLRKSKAPAQVSPPTKRQQDRQRMVNASVAKSQKLPPHQAMTSTLDRRHPVVPDQARRLTTGRGYVQNRSGAFLKAWERATRGTINVLHPSLDPKFHVDLVRSPASIQFA